MALYVRPKPDRPRALPQAANFWVHPFEFRALACELCMSGHPIRPNFFRSPKEALWAVTANYQEPFWSVVSEILSNHRPAVTLSISPLPFVYLGMCGAWFGVEELPDHGWAPAL